VQVRSHWLVAEPFPSLRQASKNESSMSFVPIAKEILVPPNRAPFVKNHQPESGTDVS
jgi:hypothetical protein